MRGNSSWTFEVAMKIKDVDKVWLFKSELV